MSGYLPVTLAAYEATKASGFYDENPGREIPITQMMGKAPTENSRGVRLVNLPQVRDIEKRLGGPIDRWMDLVSLHFEPPQVIAYRAWAGIRALGEGTTLVSSHSALLRGFAAAALGHDPGEPRNLEHVEVVHDGRHAVVSFRGETAEVDVPAELPPWLDASYLEAGERTAHRW